MSIFDAIKNLFRKENSKQVSVYLPGGGTTAVWQVGFLAEMERQGYTFTNFVCSSAGSFAALIAIAAKLKGVTMRELADQMVDKVHNSELIDWPTLAMDVVVSLLQLRVREFTLWSRENYSRVLSEIFTITDPESGEKRLLNVGDLQDSGFNLAIQFTVDEPAEGIRYPLLLTVSPYQEYIRDKENVDEEEIRQIDFGTIAAIAMCFPGLLPPANDFVRAFGADVPKGASVIDGDLLADPARLEDTTDYVYNSPTLMALKWFKKHARKGERLIALSTGASEEADRKDPVFAYMAGIDETARRFNKKDRDGFAFIVDRFDPGANVPILFNNIQRFYEEGLAEGKRFLAELSAGIS
jgi:hypothetical protein